MSESKKQDDVVISISNLTKEYKMFARKKDRLVETVFPFMDRHGVFKAMDDLNLEVRKGEVLGVLGKNGAGKSTLLKMITGVVFATSGELKVNGKISSLLELGTAFNPELTGMENIYQHGQVMGLTNEEIKEKEQEIIEFADIGDHLMQPVKTYSSGMFARLAFACAINVDPDILIVDEVLSVGDMAFQLKCFKKFEQFKERGKTILFVTHSIGDVLRNCTRTIIIDSGRKIFDGDVKDGVEKYKKIIVGLSDKESKEQVLTDDEEIKKNKNYIEKEVVKDKAIWKTSFIQNEKLIDYGNGKAEVIDYGIFDENDEVLNIVENDKPVILKSKIIFKEDVSDPIFTMTVKDFKGLEMCGTNTIIERIVTGKFKKGDTVVVEFKQILAIHPNKYTLSFSCTKFNERGELEILNRKYDALLFEVLSNKECVGMAKIDSDITVNKI
jgi:teichoic acid transport system ATP-binding protein